MSYISKKTKAAQLIMHSIMGQTLILNVVGVAIFSLRSFIGCLFFRISGEAESGSKKYNR